MLVTVNWERWWGFVDKAKNKISYLAVFQLEKQMLIGDLVALLREKEFVTYLRSWRCATCCLRLFNQTAPSCFSSLPAWIKLLPDTLQIDPLPRNAENDHCFEVKKHFWYMTLHSLSSLLQIKSQLTLTIKMLHTWSCSWRKCSLCISSKLRQCSTDGEHLFFLWKACWSVGIFLHCGKPTPCHC